MSIATSMFPTSKCLEFIGLFVQLNWGLYARTVNCATTVPWETASQLGLICSHCILWLLYK